MPNRLILASHSPRRRQLLELLGLPFDVVPPEVDEVPLPSESPAAFVKRVAAEKGLDVARRVEPATVLSADTIVSIDEEILGKPRDHPEAVSMLERLSGRRHTVLTAVTVTDSATKEQSSGVDETHVWFREISREMIERYLDREGVLDKAGAYAIQGFASVFIPRIEGNYPNVVGLPLPLTYDLLRRHRCL